MYRLLQANFFRLKKDITFWLFIFMTIGVALFTIIRHSMNQLTPSLDRVINEFINLIGIFIAIFVALFVGREYSDGIIRNKIVSGHKRINIYFANLIVSIVTALIAETLYITVVLLIGTNIFGKLQMTSRDIFLITLNTILVIITYCSIYNFVTMICSEITISTIICIILFIAMFVLTGALGLTVHSEPYNKITYTDENGESHITYREPNPNYPSETKMKIAKIIYLSLPTSQADEIETFYFDENLQNKRNEYLSQMPIYSLVVIGITNFFGIYLFKKKELK